MQACNGENLLNNAGQLTIKLPASALRDFQAMKKENSFSMNTSNTSFPHSFMKNSQGDYRYSRNLGSSTSKIDNSKLSMISHANSQSKFISKKSNIFNDYYTGDFETYEEGNKHVKIRTEQS